MALYHSYRPQKFSEIIGQEHIVLTLQNQILTSNPSHAYLFFGSRGTGKTTTARILAKALTCQNRKPEESEPCNECSACTSIREGNAIDVIEIDAASHTGVDNVRENIIENSQSLPTLLKYKIFIIDEVHMLSTSAFNALLKTLEEPPAHVVFILATTDPQKLPETILSRCQRFPFKKVPVETLRSHLLSLLTTEKREIPDEILERIIEKSEGGVRDAVNLLDQVLSLSSENVSAEKISFLLPPSQVQASYTLLNALAQTQLPNAFEQIHLVLNTGVSAKSFFDALLEATRNCIQAKYGVTTGTVHSLQPLIVSALTVSELLSLADILLKRKSDTYLCPIPELPLELACIEWSEAQSTPPQTKVPSQPPQSPTPPPATPRTPTTPKTDPVPQTENKPTTTPVVPTPPPSEPTQTNNGPLDQKMVETKWPQFLATIEKESPSLIFILRMATFEGVNGNTLTLGLQYKFHADKIMAANCKNRLENVLSSLVGSAVHFEATVKEKEAAPSNELNELASLIGGEVVTP